MAADWWARGIAMGAAGFAGLNMIVSAKTYLRVRPKLKVKTERRSKHPVPQINIEGNPRSAYWFRLRLINDGTTPLGVERVELYTRDSRWPFKRLRLVKGTRTLKPVTVDGLSGVIYPVVLTSKSLLCMGRGPLYARFYATLTNGQTVRGRRMWRFPGLKEGPEPPP
ncbi:hypothetical protein ACFWY6_06495 [Streptomyces sp. NPDC059037]|uniref:hypothetical protein n=1 Tax=Streptomyces sp. NPDC059037 TaxID=3346710 RepID=UPI0036B25661